MNLQPYVVDVPQITLDDLSNRLARARRPDEIDGVGWALVPIEEFTKRISR